MLQCCGQHKTQKLCSFLGACLLLAPVTIHFIWGNFSIYVMSYIHRHSPSLSGAEASWVTALFLMLESLSMMASWYLISRLGKRTTSVIGVAILNGGTLTSYFTIEHSMSLLDVSLGAVTGVGGGLLYGSCTAYIVEWSGEKDLGKSTALLHNSYNVMAIALNQIITLYINPHEELPKIIKGSDYAYFTEQDVLDRVPRMFLILGALFLAIQVVGLVLVRDNSSSSSHTTSPAEGGLENTTLTTTRHASSTDTEKKVSSLDDARGIGPREVLNTASFHFIWIAFFATEFSFIQVTTYYKVFGQLWINDDYFLTKMGTAYLILIVSVKLILGVFLDRLGFKLALVLAHAIIAVCGGFLYVAPQLSRWFYFLLVILSVSVSGTVFLIDAVAIVKLYGRRCAVVNIGLLNVATISMMAIAPPVMTWLLDVTGWACLFVTGAVLSAVGLVLVVIGVPIE